MPSPDTRYSVPGWLRQQMGVGRIGPEARKPAGTAYGVGIESIERGWLTRMYPVPPATVADYVSLTSGTFTQVDATNLQWAVTLSGRRPVELHLEALVKYVTGGGYVALSFIVNGVEVTGGNLGCWYTDTASTWLTAACTWVLDAPAAGENTVAVAYKVNAAGSLNVSGTMPTRMRVKEI